MLRILVRIQNELQAPLLKKRAALVARISDFWAVVLEQAPTEIDQYISPSDSAALASLTSLDVTRFEIAHATASDTPGKGDPRSVSFTFEFAENAFFTDKVLTKKFWYRRADDGWTGLVSEPVKIHWKDGKDLTGGMLDLAVRVWEREEARAQSSHGGAGLEPVDEYGQLVKKVEQMNAGAVSFFAWFGYRGRAVSSEESARATKKEEERRAKVKKEEFGVGDSTDENGAKGKEPAEAENGEATKESSDEEQSKSDKASDDMDVSDGGSEVERVSDKASEYGHVSDEASEDQDVSAKESEDEGMSDGDIEDEEVSDGASEDANVSVSDSGIPAAPGMEREIFPAGENLAVSLSEDLFPGAIKYFSKSTFPFDPSTSPSITNTTPAEAHDQGDDSGSEPSEASDLPEEDEDGRLDPPDLEDSALVSMVESDDERAKKRKRV